MYQKLFIKNNVSVLLLITFDENSKITMYKVAEAVVYTIIDDNICLDYLDSTQKRLSKYGNNFENIKFNNLSGLGIPEILMNVMSCHGSAKYSILAVILTCN